MNHLMLLDVHKDLSDNLDLTVCANDFVSAMKTCPSITTVSSD